MTPSGHWPDRIPARSSWLRSRIQNNSGLPSGFSCLNVARSSLKQSGGVSVFDQRRREFIRLLAGTAAWPFAARAEGVAQRRVGVLMNGAATEAELQSHVASFVQGLQQLGWIE